MVTPRIHYLKTSSVIHFHAGRKLYIVMTWCSGFLSWIWNIEGTAIWHILIPYNR